MDIVEGPPITNDDAPLGTLVMLSLDPVASVADMKDEEASAAAAKLPRRKHLAIVFAPELNAFAPLDIQPLTFQFYGICHGLPAIRPRACIGLGPQATLIEGRDPLQTTTPLPWNDCYIQFSCMFTAIVTRLHLATPLCAIPRSDILTVLNAKADAEVEDGFDQATIPGSEGQDDAPEEPIEQTRSPSRSSFVSGDQPVPDRPASAASVSSSERLNRLCSQPPQMRPRVEIWLDLALRTDSTDFCPPGEILDTLDELDKIEEEWATRAAAALMVDRPRTTQWAAEVADAQPDDPNSNNERLVPAAFDDEAVRPEDAVDYREPEVRDAKETPAAAPNPSRGRKALCLLDKLQLKGRIKRATLAATKPVKKMSKLLFSRKK